MWTHSIIINVHNTIAVHTAENTNVYTIYISNGTHRESTQIIYRNLGRKMKWCFRPLLCTLFRLNLAKLSPGQWGEINYETCHEWVRTIDPVIGSPTRYPWKTTAPARNVGIYAWDTYWWYNDLALIVWPLNKGWFGEIIVYPWYKSGNGIPWYVNTLGFIWSLNTMAKYMA